MTPDIDTILATVSRYRHISIDDLKGPSRRKTIASARQEVFWLARKHSGLSLPEIAYHVGDRDHTTVMHGADRVQNLIETDAVARVAIEQMEMVMETFESCNGLVEIIRFDRINPFTVARKVLHSSVPAVIVTADEIRAMAHFISKIEYQPEQE